MANATNTPVRSHGHGNNASQGDNSGAGGDATVVLVTNRAVCSGRTWLWSVLRRSATSTT